MATITRGTARSGADARAQARVASSTAHLHAKEDARKAMEANTHAKANAANARNQAQHRAQQRQEQLDAKMKGREERAVADAAALDAEAHSTAAFGQQLAADAVGGFYAEKARRHRRMSVEISAGFEADLQFFEQEKAAIIVQCGVWDDQ